MKIIKKEYQQEAVNNTLKLIKRKESTGLLEMATGTGKTITSALIIKEFEAEFGYKKHVFIVPKNTILTNILRDYEAVFPEKKIGVWNTSNKDEDWDILLTTFHSLSTKRVYDKFGNEKFGIVIFDEAHLSDNNSCDFIKESYNYDFILNQTATPFLQSKTETFLEKMAGGNLIYKLGIFEAIQKGYLSKAKYEILLDMQDGQTVENILRNSGTEEYSTRLTQDYVKSKARNEFVVKKLRDKNVFDLHDNFLVYAINKSHMYKVIDFWKSKGILTKGNYAVILGGTSQHTREEIFKQFESGNLKYIFSIRTLTEGVDIKGAQAIINLAPTKSKVLFFQKLGRVIRKEEGKEFGFVYDFVFDYAQKQRIAEWLKEKMVAEKLINKTRDSNKKQQEKTEEKENEFDKVIETSKDIGFEIDFEEDFFLIEKSEKEKLTREEMKEEYLKLCGDQAVAKAYFDKIINKKFMSIEAIEEFGTWQDFLDFVGVSGLVNEEINSKSENLTKEQVIEIMKHFSKDKFNNLRYSIVDYNRVSNRPFDTKFLIDKFGSWSKLMQAIGLEHTVAGQMISQERALSMFKANFGEKLPSLKEYVNGSTKPLSLNAIQLVFGGWEELKEAFEKA